MKTPASLIDRVRSTADQEAWSRLVQLYLPFICYWGRQAGLQEADMADLSQEVFTLLYQVLPEFTYDARKSFRHWLRKVTLNKLRALRRRRTPGQGPSEAWLGNLADADSHEQNWEAEHQAYLATRALQLMRADFDPPTWQACWDTIVENRSPADVAQKLGISVGAVYAAKSRILRRLRQELAGLL